MPIVRGGSDFKWMLDYELGLAERHRRFVSLAMIKTDARVSPETLLSNTMRNSDVYFEVDKSVGAVLMSETDSVGNQIAIRRYKSACNGAVGIYFASVCYPDDHLSASSMISALHEQLLAAEKESQTEAAHD